jgi:hypothetical protein
MLLIELMNWSVVRNMIKALWHVGRGTTSCPPDPGAAVFIRINRRIKTPPPASNHKSHFMPPEPSAQTGLVVAEGNVEHRPPTHTPARFIVAVVLDMAVLSPKRSNPLVIGIAKHV